MTRDQDIATALEAIRERVRYNEPRHRDPEAFHVEKSELTGAITGLITAVRHGKPVPKVAKTAKA